MTPTKIGEFTSARFCGSGHENMEGGHVATGPQDERVPTGAAETRFAIEPLRPADKVENNESFWPVMSRTWKWIGGRHCADSSIPTVVVLLDANHFQERSRARRCRNGRELAINGDLKWNDWPRIHLHAVDVTFANPSWAREKQMIAAAAVDVDVDPPALAGHGSDHGSSIPWSYF
jgi:hypothetical protein